MGLSLGAFVGTLVGVVGVAGIKILVGVSKGKGTETGAMTGTDIGTGKATGGVTGALNGALVGALDGCFVEALVGCLVVGGKVGAFVEPKPVTKT